GAGAAVAAGDAEERREGALAVAKSDAGAAIADSQARPVAVGPHADIYRRRAVALCVLDQVAHHAPQERAVAEHGHGLTADRAMLVAGGLLGRERKEVHLLAPVQALDRIEAAGEQDLVDQCIELGDVALE